MHLGLCSGRGRTKAMKRDGLFVLYLRGYISHLLAYKHLFHEVIFLKNLFFSYRHRKVAMNSYIFSLLPIFFFFFFRKASSKVSSSSKHGRSVVLYANETSQWLGLFSKTFCKSFLGVHTFLQCIPKDLCSHRCMNLPGFPESPVLSLLCGLLQCN